MKTNRFRRAAAGFSLMELVVVVALIVALAALTMGGLSFMEQKKARSTAALQIKLLENALQDYHSDNRSFPSNPNSEGLNGSEELFKALYQDPFDADTKVYLAELDPDTHGEGKGGQAWVRKSSVSAEIVDPWGNPYRYRSGDSPGAINPDFDLWSMGKDGRTNADPKHADCLDDIRNF